MSGPLLVDRVKEVATVTGTGSVTLGGAPTGFRTFLSGVGNGNSCYYCLASRTSGNWEVGTGTYSSSGNSLSRTPSASSNSGSLVVFAGEVCDVFVTATASFLSGLGTSAPLTLTCPSDSSKGLVVKANSATQSANLWEIQDSTGFPYVYVDPYDDLVVQDSLGQQSFLNSTSNGFFNVLNNRQGTFYCYFVDGTGFLMNGLGPTFDDGSITGKAMNWEYWNGSGYVYLMKLSPNAQLAVNSVTNAPSAQLQVDSTTRGFLPPRMTTSQESAISSPAEGLLIYNTTLHKLRVRTTSAWETVTSS